jgi:hypothetical protein
MGANWGLLEVPLDTCSTTAAAAAAAPAPDVLVHRKFFVVQFLMQSLPAGCCYTPLKQLGQCGVLVHRSCKHAVLLYVNAHRTKPRTLAVDAALWLKSAAVAADGASSMQEEHGEQSTSTPVQPTAGTAAAVAAAAEADPVAAAAEADPSVRVLVTVTLLNLEGLQSVQYTAAAGLGGIPSSSTVQKQRVAGNGWPLLMEVPPASLCRVELLA